MSTASTPFEHNFLPTFGPAQNKHRHQWKEDIIEIDNFIDPIAPQVQAVPFRYDQSCVHNTADVVLDTIKKGPFEDSHRKYGEKGENDEGHD
jgi:hypothetical protein